MGACIQKGDKCRVPAPMTVRPRATPHLICRCVTVRSLYVRIFLREIFARCDYRNSLLRCNWDNRMIDGKILSKLGGSGWMCWCGIHVYTDGRDAAAYRGSCHWRCQMCRDTHQERSWLQCWTTGLYTAVLNPRLGLTMDVLSPLTSVLCHSDWLFHSSRRRPWALHEER